MTANTDNRQQQKESIDIDWTGRNVADDLAGLDDETVALLIEEEKQGVRESADEAARALLNEGVELSDEKVADFWDSVERLNALSRTVADRVPEEHRFSEE